MALNTFLQKIESRWLFLLDQIIMSGGNFLQAILVAKLLGMEALGTYSIYIAIYLALLAIQQSNIHYSLEVLMHYHRISRKDKLEKSLLVRQLFWVFILILIGFITSYITQIMMISKFYIGSLVFMLLHDFFRKYNTVNQNTKVLLISDTSISFLQLSLIFILIFLKIETYQIVPLTLLLSYGFGVILDLTYSSIYSAITWKYCWIHFIKDLQQSKSLILSASLQWFSGHFLTISLGMIGGMAIAGYFRLIQLLLGFLHLVLQTIEGYLPGNIIYQKQCNSNLSIKTALFTAFKNWFWLYVGLIFIIILIAIFLSRILNIENKENFISYLFLFIPVYALIYFNTFLKIKLRIELKNNSILIASFISALFTLVASNLLISWAGILGLVIHLGIIQLLLLSIFVYSSEFMGNHLTNTNRYENHR